MFSIIIVVLEVKLAMKDRSDREIGHNSHDIYYIPELDYPVIEATNNALLWPEGPKGRIDLTDTYEVSSVPEDPATPMETVDKFVQKGIMP
jgi:hypothetical protein